jgi:hypothetical protein
MVAGRVGAGVAGSAARTRLAAWWHGEPDPSWVDESSALLAAQQRSGRARSRANALARATAQGQERCKRRIVWRRGAPPSRRHAAADSATPWLGDGQLAVQQQRLRPAGEVLGGKDELQPDLVAAPAVEREVGQAGGVGGADAVLHPGALAVAQLQPSKVRVGLVGEEDLEAVAIVVGEAQLGAGWASRGGRPPACPPARWAGRPGRSARPPPRRGGPARRGRSLGSSPARAGPRSPHGRGRRSACPPRIRRPGRAGATPAGCSPRRCRFGPGPAGHPRRWELRQGEVDQLDKVAGRPGSGVARPQDPSQRLTWALPRSR